MFSQSNRFFWTMQSAHPDIFSRSILLACTLVFMLPSCNLFTTVQRVIAPHDAKPGFVITTLEYVGQKFSPCLAEVACSRADLPCNFTKYFNIFDNGDIVSIFSLELLLGQQIGILIESRLAFQTWSDAIQIQIKDGAEVLSFSQPSYEGYLAENSPVNSKVLNLENLRAGKRLGSVSIHYSIISGSLELFKLSQLPRNILEIRTLAPMDYEANTQHNLMIMALSNDTDDEPVFVRIWILVGNLNDNYPEFDEPVYTTIVTNEDVEGKEIVETRAYDADREPVTYRMETNSCFDIDPITGSVSLSCSVPELEWDAYDLEIFAVDADKHVSKPARVHVDVDRSHLGFSLPVSDGNIQPRIRRDLRPAKQIEVPESTFGDIVDLENNLHEVFSFKEPAPKNLDINPVTGVVRLRDGEKLDYETQPEINFVVVVSRIDDASFRDEQPVKVRLSDINDELPVFKNVPQPFLSTISANALPGTSVYQLMAQDADEGSIVRYILESGGEDRFEVEQETGVVRSKGTDPFQLGKEYEIGVSAQDVNVKTLQRSATHSLKILVGERDPQFYETQFVASVPETAAEQFKIIEMKAYSHQGYPLTYELTTDTGAQSNEFAIDHVTGMVDLLRTLDYEKDPHQFHLKVKAIENGRPTRSSVVNLIVNLADMNDNAPTFPLSQYIVQGIAETVAIGTDIIQVTATDQDSVTNSQLTYTVSDHSFSVQTLNNIGYIKTARRLDYDSRNCHTYNFTIVATDNGSPVHHGSANVRVSVTNVNDEDPVFMQPVEHVMVSEDAPPNTVVHVIQAFDPDGDDVIYTFAGGSLADGPFNIDSKSGIITLVGSLSKSQVSYRLNITAKDNGRCCGGSTSRSSKGVVVIAIKDINNNAPRFPDCANYFPTVLEKENVGTFVIQVKAIDLDTGANGNITYSLIKSNDQSTDRFEVDPLTGVVKTADVFDREGQIGVTDYQVTVKAQDQGNPSLAGFCTFRVKIGDKNDNPPVFNLPHYTTSIEERSIVGRRVKQVYANDRDAGDNGKVEYFISDDPSGFFTINHYSGWVTVVRPIFGRRDVQLEIEARDRGLPSKSSFVRMDIEITQTVNAYPQWVEDYTTVVARISESEPVNTIVRRLKAISTIPDSLVNYIIQPGETPEQNGQPRSFYCRIDEERNEMILLTYRPLDYETVPQYILTIKAANRATNSLHNDTRLVIDVLDANDEIPQFIGMDENGRYAGSIAENLEPGTEVITVTATDRDEFPDFKKITYRIKEAGIDNDKFSIDNRSGMIRSVISFDCEMKKDYYITVIAEDGAQSDRPNHYPPGTPNQGETEVHIHVTDMNDNAPYFREKSYSTRVPENSDPGTVIITVTAEDKDEENRLTYSITGGNLANVFEVVPDIGEIKIRRSLDYENGPRSYQLTYRVFDDKYANTTTVFVQVLDVNDNPPKFDNAIYNVTDAQEEESGISKNNPKYLLTVRATDPDIDRKTHIRYSLTGQFIDDGTFIINEHTGEIYLTRSLDRDHPRGRPVWNFNVLAYDESDSFQSSLTGYAEVRIIPRDINDNAPVFDRNRLVGRVPEHSRSGMTILTVIATDADSGNNGSVIYSLKQVPMKGSQPLFSIDSHMGLISTMLNNALDREVQSVYYLIVQAKDRGSPPMSASATVTIVVDDINDHAPRFSQMLYRTTMSESFPKGSSVTSVSATDPDVGGNAKLSYTLKEQDREYFYISSIEATNTGVLKVFKPVDFDSLPNPFFNLTVYVQDSDATHVDTAFVEVQVTDYNDNAPIFVPNTKKVTVYENITIGTTLHKFSSLDKDTGINKQFSYVIDRLTDSERQFSVDGNGLVTTARNLDREIMPGHRVHILAIDKGVPAQTGTGTLIVNLMDVNDNYPQFADDYRPVIYENFPAGRSIVEISATDRDTLTNGPPFEFLLPCSGGCPCHANPACHDFAFKFISGGGDNGHGSGIVSSLKTFDREVRKEYHVPIVMRDSGNPPMSGTNTLTITIGDTNDNKHQPGHKHIFVYSYKGIFENLPLGNVYAEDEDDWDIDNKTFSFVDGGDREYFGLDQDSGQLSSNGRLREGEYQFHVKVYDAIWKLEVVSSVSVTVKEIGDEAIINTGSLRIQGMTSESFIDRRKLGSHVGDYRKSKYDLLRERLAQQLGISYLNVDITTVMDHATFPKTIDVRFSAHDKQYYRPVKLNGLVFAHRDEYEELLGGKLLMVPIDECLEERCESDGCSNVLVTTGLPLLINTNSTAFVGLSSFTQMECTCQARTFVDNSDVECQPGSCLNGGTCIQRDYGFVCQCLSEFDGPRCQQTKHSFRGDGWAWYKSLAQCEGSHTSLEFITTRDNGLILYHGPVGDAAIGGKESQDFLLLELRNGYPFLRVNFGSGETKLTVDGRDKFGHVRLPRLNDGHWHRVDIIRSGKQVRLVVDRCEVTTTSDRSDDYSFTEDRRACEASSEIVGDKKYLNVNAPLQLGGRANSKLKYPQNILKEGFQGCIKNLIHNGELYDLYVGQVGEQRNAEDGCQREESLCKPADSMLGPRCGNNSTCIGSFHSVVRCVCRPGWRGTHCSIPTTVKDFREYSFMEWDFQDRFFKQVERNFHRTDIQLMFRTRRSSGLLFKVQNAQKSEYMLLDIAGYHVRFRFNFGGGEQLVTLASLNVSDGVWHTLYVERVGQWAVLKLDGGEGRFFNETLLISSGLRNIRVSQRSLFAGGDVRFPSSSLPPLIDSDYQNGCLSDIRYNGEWLPMDPSQNRESRAADYQLRSQNVLTGCHSDMCISDTGITCLYGLICVDLWRHAECRCPPGRRLVTHGSYDLCENLNECLEFPMICNNGDCRDVEDGYYCHCHPGYEGHDCTEKKEIASAFVSTTALLTISVCGLVVFFLILIMLVLSCRRQPESYSFVVNPDEDIRENIIHYDEEGVGEEDQNAYDINKLKKPITEQSGLSVPLSDNLTKSTIDNKEVHHPSIGCEDLDNFINSRLKEVDEDPNAPPYDTVREYAYEGSVTTNHSLSSIESSSDGGASRGCCDRKRSEQLKITSGGDCNQKRIEVVNKKLNENNRIGVTATDL